MYTIESHTDLKLKINKNQNFLNLNISKTNAHFLLIKMRR